MDEPVLAAAVPRVLHSDPHDFAGLYVRHRSAFTLHARRYLRDPRDADEVVQEAFLRLFLALPELETELQALAYCRRTITNLCIDRYRAQARRPSLVDLDSVPLEQLAEDDPGDPVVRAEDAAIVREALSLLSPLHRAALVKREIEEKTVPVIAAELEIPEESVKHVLFRARRALRRLLAATTAAPGAELDGALGRAARAGSGGLAAFLAFLLLSLSTGPDLRAIPVVGSDLPDLLPVEEIASGIGRAVETVVAEVAEVVRTVGGDGGSEVPEDVSDPAPVAVPSPSASPSPPGRRPSPAVTPTAVPTPVPPPVAVPAPSAVVEPTSTPSPSPAVTGSPLPTPEPTSTPTPSTVPSPSGSAVPTPSASPTGSDERRDPRGPGPRKEQASRSTPSPEPSA